jgi:predicted nucleotidyltransferase
MVSMKKIRALARRIAREFHPERVVLFGSYAEGRPTADSDVDLLVVLAHERRAIDKAVEIRLALSPEIPLDILVRTPETIRKRIRMGDTFLSDILDNGKVLYEAAHD